MGLPIRWLSLNDAWRESGFHNSIENLPLVQHIVDQIGVEYFAPAGVGKRIAAIRKDGNRVIHIHPGFTHGFTTKEELEKAVGELPHLGIERHSDGLWRVLHLTFGSPRGSLAKSSNFLKTSRVCPNCTFELLPNGQCDNCGWMGET